MKKSGIFAAVVAVLFFLFAGSHTAFAGRNNELTLKVDNIRSDEGYVLMALMRSADWTKMDYITADIAESSTQGVVFTVADLPLGEKFYIFVFHDENGNKVMDLNEKGMPLEGFVAGGTTEFVPTVTIAEGKQTTEVSMTYLFKK